MGGGNDHPADCPGSTIVDRLEMHSHTPNPIPTHIHRHTHTCTLDAPPAMAPAAREMVCVGFFLGLAGAAVENAITWGAMLSFVLLPVSGGYVGVYISR